MSTLKTPSPRQATELEATAKAAASFSELFERWSQARAHEAGVSMSRFKLVYTLHCDGAQKMSQLADHLGVTPRNVTALVDGLEGEGLVQRKPHPSDRRATLVELSSSGDRLAQQYDTYTAALLSLFSTLTREDRAALSRILGQLNTAMTLSESGSR